MSVRPADLAPPTSRAAAPALPFPPIAHASQPCQQQLPTQQFQQQ